MHGMQNTLVLGPCSWALSRPVHAVFKSDNACTLKTHCLCALQSVEQIAVADIILLNKVDLVDEAQRQRIVSRIKASR